jgi:glycosyltransferase involved in cell wall biosynthesis
MATNERIAIITPVKNEMNNLKELIASVEKQTHPISLWIIINDNSDDGSGEFLEKIIPFIKNVDKVILYHLTSLEKDYKLGSKYSQVISYGFEMFNTIRKKQSSSFNFVGILDSDCFIEENYYKKLIKRFNVLPKLGIASGVIYYRINGKLIYDKMPLRWARGAIRLWRIDCFDEAGYIIGNSADAISTALAWTKGWESQSFKEILAESREMGTRIDPIYYGKSAYYRYTPHYYVLMRFFILLFRSGFNSAFTTYRGFLSAKKNKLPRIVIDNKTINYFKLLLWRNIVEYFIVYKNYKILKKHNIYLN